MKRLALILPCYNEEAVLESSFNRLELLFKDLITKDLITSDSKICFVDDGSRDLTWTIISELAQKSEFIRGVKLSRNFGHQYALLAGMESQAGQFDIYITIDVDLQDDITVIEQMIREYEHGAMLIYGVRDDRTSDTAFKRISAQAFYKLLRSMGTEMIYNHGDFRLIDDRVLREFLGFHEKNLYLRGIFPLLGFKTSIIKYSRSRREAGSTKYPISKQVALAWNGVTAFSNKPLRLILYLGLFTFVVSIILAIWATVIYLMGNTIHGWFSIIVPITLFGGIQMISLGIIGEYIGKIFTEVKSRPRYIIEKMIS